MKHIIVVAAVIERGDTILCVQRGQARYEYLSEKWEFPGGKMEADETEQETIQREIMEELGMAILIHSKLVVVEHHYPDFHLTMHAYRCSSADEPQLKEHQASAWLAKRELNKLDWAAADIPIVNALL